MQGQNSINSVQEHHLWGAKGAPILFSEIGLLYPSRWGAVGFVDFTKLSFALSSLEQPFDQI